MVRKTSLLSATRRCFRPLAAGALLALVAFLAVVPARLWAGHAGGFGFVGAVGGIAIDTEGILREPNVESRKLHVAEYRKTLKEAPPELGMPVGLRMVSLKGLEAAVRDALERGADAALPEEVRFLAGLQRVEYVFVYPEENDVVLAGPGEGWTVNDAGQVVGVTTGRPVVRLDDLIVALRSVEEAFKTGISCSINPTPEGRRALDEYLKKVTSFHPGLLKRMAEVLGPQTITLTGVPTDSALARVLVAADYRMKRYGMGLDKAPISGLPSFLEMVEASKTRIPKDASPRWWLECDYEPLEKSADGRAWRLSGGVKCLTEDDFVADGVAERTGKANPVAQAWADAMTEKYDELAAKDPVFADLQNVMDLCVVAALIDKEDLLNVAGCELPTLVGKASPLASMTWNVPKRVDSQCSFIRAGKEYFVTTSGGVQIESFDVVEQAAEVSARVAEVQRQAARPAEGASWWWNG